jgi:hypothetical protein
LTQLIGLLEVQMPAGRTQDYTEHIRAGLALQYESQQCKYMPRDDPGHSSHYCRRAFRVSVTSLDAVRPALPRYASKRRSTRAAVKLGVILEARRLTMASHGRRGLHAECCPRVSLKRRLSGECSDTAVEPIGLSSHLPSHHNR